MEDNKQPSMQENEIKEGWNAKLRRCKNALARAKVKNAFVLQAQANVYSAMIETLGVLLHHCRHQTHTKPHKFPYPYYTYEVALGNLADATEHQRYLLHQRKPATPAFQPRTAQIEDRNGEKDKYPKQACQRDVRP